MNTTEPPVFPAKCRDEGHAFIQATERNPFGGPAMDKTFCSRCGIDQYRASWWMKEALKREVESHA